MPWMGRRSRPVPDAGHRRNSSIVESKNIRPATPEEEIHEPVGPLKRLSLRLPHSQDEPFPSILSTAPEEMEDRESSGRESANPTPEREAAPSQPEEPRQQQQERIEQERASSHPVKPKPQRFSLLKFRHASDPQLSSSYRNTAFSHPHLPHLPPPTIITTSPTSHHLEQPMKTTKRNIFDRSKRPSRGLNSSLLSDGALDVRPGSTQSLNVAPSPMSGLSSNGSKNGSPQPSTIVGPGAPPPYGDESTSALAIPVARLSESSRSDGSSEHGIYAQTTTTHTVSTTTTFFRLPRRKKNKGPLFPLPSRTQPVESGRSSTSRTPRASTAGRTSMSPSRDLPPPTSIRFDPESSNKTSPFPSPTQSILALTNAPFGSPGPSVVRKESMMSARSGASTPSVSLAPPRLGIRGRSSTMGSLGRSVETLNDHSPGVAASGRNSTSTTGRKSFGDIFSRSHRLRQNSEPNGRNGSGHSPGTPGSKSNSLQIPREPEPELVYPEREDSDTPTSYLEKLEAAVPRGSMATILCKSSDEFSKICLRKYMRGFSYFGDSIDIAVRKMLMEVELPKETQQIDRLLAGFADRYHECNPGIFSSVDEASIAAFSILLLHSDTHNKNNKRKMQKQDYVKNTQGPVQLSADILQCFYDNVCYTPFIHFEDEIAVHSHRLAAPKSKKSLIKTRSSESLRGPVDPYALILDNKLHALRPSLKDVMDTEDTYSFTGTTSVYDVKELHNAFLKSSILQIVSARSRPDAFMNQATISNPAEAQAGLVSIKVAKVGLLWRKDPKKKKAKRPWQEWGAILTDSKLYFFRDVGWIKKLITQYEVYPKHTKKRPLVFTPPLTNFEPDALMSVDDAVALMDSSYKKHKNAFVFIKHGGFEEIFLANNESDMNDWLGKLNYAATFRTAGVRMRGLVGTPHEAHQMIRKDSQISTTSTESQPTEPPVQSRKIDPQVAWEIMYYRRQIINERISDYDEKLAVAQKELDHLLRNARHLQILLPIQAKTREAVILAAGRMSAKLKWTRIEVWRLRCHRDMLKSDLEQEGSTDFPVPRSMASSATVTPQKAPPLKTSHQGINRTDTDTSHATLSPISLLSGQAALVSSPINIDRLATPDDHQATSPLTPVSSTRRKSTSGLDVKYVARNSPSSQSAANFETAVDSHSLLHRASIISSHRSKVDAERYVKPLGDAEEQVLREAGLMGIDGTVPSSKRPDTSGSEKDRVGSISTDMGRDRGGSVRRSLQRTLRESNHHHSLPHHHRSKKGRDSGSSITVTEDGTKSLSGESLELRRGTGSFIVHGKKASVVTFGSEWQSMSNEDRLKLRKIAHEEEAKAEDAIAEDGTASNVSGASATVAPEEVADKATMPETRRQEEGVPVEEADGHDYQSAAEEGPESDAADDFHSATYHRLSTSAAETEG